jgi:hypothetical protein
MAKQNQKGAIPVGLALSPFDTFVTGPCTSTRSMTERQSGQSYPVIPLPEEANVEQAKVKFEESRPSSERRGSRQPIAAEPGCRAWSLAPCWPLHRSRHRARVPESGVNFHGWE